MMKASVIDRDRTIRFVDDAPIPSPGHGEVLVELHRVGVCGTDLGYYVGEREVPENGWVLGHEGTGIIRSVGEGADPALVGTRIAIEPNFPCGDCDLCRSGLTALCQTRGSLALNRPGLFAQFAAVPAPYCWPIPADLSDDLAAIVEPAAVCLASIRRSGIIDDPRGRRVLVVGAGALGLLMIELLRVMGCETSVLERNEKRRARALSSDHVDAHDSDEDFYEVVFDTTGTSAGGEAALGRVAIGGTLVVIGVGNDPIPVDTRILVRRGIRIQGSMIYDHPIDFAATVQFLTERAVDVSRVIGPRYPLDQVESAFHDYHDSVGKIIIEIAEVK